jgi:hypothetical protein
MNELELADVEPAAEASPPALRARARLVELLAEYGIEASSDAGAFYPQPIGVLVGLPSLTARGLSSRTFDVPVVVVSGDALNAELPVARLYALADDVALAVRTNTYRATSWRGNVNAEPLPAIELLATVTVTEEA